jgi:WD40 repeat protein
MLLIVVTLAAVGHADQGKSASDPSADESIRTICPGLERLPRPEDPSGPGIDDHRWPEIVLLVEKIKVPEKADDGRLRERERCNVKRVLYGTYAEKTVSFEWPGERTLWYWGTGEFIVGLIPAFYKEQEDFTAQYGVPGADEKAEAALGRARLDFAALAADSIFVGRELSTGGSDGPDSDRDWNRSTVEVVGVIHGPALKPGAKVQVIDEGLIHISNYHRRASPQQRIFFTVQGNREKRSDDSYHVISHLSADQEPKVLEALKHAGDHCITYERKEDGETTKVREVLFDGTDAQAIELLGADNEQAVSLFYRTLVHRRKTSRLLVVADIEQAMFRMMPLAQDKQAGFRRLSRLIDVLGDMQHEDGGKDVQRLIEIYLGRVEQGLPEPAKVGAARNWESDYHRTDVNRSLVWLLLRLGEEPGRQQFGKRLAALRAKAQGGWKNELQIAMNAIKLEDSEELAAAMLRMRDVRPVRSKTTLRHKGSEAVHLVRFSHDGKLLATAGHGDEIKLWNTSDWSPAAVIAEDASIEALLFSPDDRFLYVAGGGYGLQVHARFDCRTGNRDKAYEGHRKGLCEMVLSPDGRTMVTSSFYEKSMHFWDTESGRILRTIPVSIEESHFFLSPDGKGIVRPVKRKGKPAGDGKQPAAADGKSDGEQQAWLFEPFRGEESVEVSIPSKGESAVWSAADPTVAYWGYREPVEWFSKIGPGHIVSGHWTDSGFKKLEDRKIDAPGLRKIVVSADGKLLAVAREDTTVSFFSLPALKSLGNVSLPQHRSNQPYDYSLAFSPDGKLLVVGRGDPTPRLIRTDTFEQLLPAEGHAGHIEDVFFSADGKRLLSYADDNTICTWDAASMKMLRRVEIPLDYTWAGIRPSDGRFAICFPAPNGLDSWDRPADANKPARVIDAESGQFISHVPLTNAWMFWIDDNEAAMVEHSLDKGKSQIRRFDYRTGKILSTTKMDDDWYGAGELSEDGRSVFAFEIESEGRATWAAPDILSLSTGKVTKPARDHSDRARVHRAGLVPGGKYFYLADPHLYIYDRKTMKQVAKEMFDGVDLLGLTFSGDGSRNAIVSGGRIFVEDLFKWYDPKTQSIVRIHETLSGKTLLAFPASTRWARVRFSPDGKRLAVINDDGTIEVWMLPI